MLRLIKMKILSCCVASILMISSAANADQFCFALAETYYEQVYCQLQAKAQTKNLPPFNQFKKNNEQVQASLLKRPAGNLIFSNNLRSFKLDSEALGAYTIKDISGRTIDEDFKRNPKIHQCWLITH